MAAGGQIRRTFWSALKKRTERWFGTERRRASENWSSNLRLRTKCIPASQTRFNQEQAKLLLHNLGSRRCPPQVKPAPLMILLTRCLQDTIRISPALSGQVSTSRKKFTEVPSGASSRCRFGSISLMPPPRVIRREKSNSLQI